jgi:hypothetical protein
MTGDQADPLENVAEALHEGWMEYRLAQGCVLGPERTATTHPHLCPWSELDRESQNQDRFIAAVLLDRWVSKSLTIEQLPEAIHDAWCRWVFLEGRAHAHAQPFAVAHRETSDDHAVQAARIEPILRSLLGS